VATKGTGTKPPRKRKVTTPKKMGRPLFKPTDQQRNMVMILRSNGIDPADIASEIGCSENTLYRHFRVEMETGKARIVAKIGASLAIQAIKGNLTAAIFYLRTHDRENWNQSAPPPPPPGSGGDDDGPKESVKITIIGGLPD
jgi:hypothetical protein